MDAWYNGKGRFHDGLVPYGPWRKVKDEGAGPWDHDWANSTVYPPIDLWPGNERWFTLHYGNCAFYFLDNYSDHAPGTEQYEWFIAGLQADSANPQVRHILSYFTNPLTPPTPPFGQPDGTGLSLPAF